jgi:hypothetical protein
MYIPGSQRKERVCQSMPMIFLFCLQILNRVYVMITEEKGKIIGLKSL